MVDFIEKGICDIGGRGHRTSLLPKLFHHNMKTILFSVVDSFFQIFKNMKYIVC